MKASTLLKGLEPFCRMEEDVSKGTLNKRADSECLRQLKLYLGNYNEGTSESCIRLFRNNLKFDRAL